MQPLESDDKNLSLGLREHLVAYTVAGHGNIKLIIPYYLMHYIYNEICFTQLYKHYYPFISTVMLYNFQSSAHGKWLSCKLDGKYELSVQWSQIWNMKYFVNESNIRQRFQLETAIWHRHILNILFVLIIFKEGWELGLLISKGHLESILF